jgi:hypothetical protein
MSRLLSFGVYRFKPISEVPYDYLQWCLATFADSKRRRLIQVEVERRDRVNAYRDGKPDPTKPPDKQPPVKPAIPSPMDLADQQKRANVAMAAKTIRQQVELIQADECPY